jgi:hypothetical protein
MILITASTIASGEPMSAGGPQSWVLWAIGLGVGLAVFLACRGLITVHWKRVRKDAGAGEFASVWTDVILRVVSYVGVLVVLLSVLGLVASMLNGQRSE